MRQKVRLINQENHHNKYYEMEEKRDAVTGDVYIEVTYGRMGTAGQHAIYPISQWDKKYKEKIRKGYTDVSESNLSFEDIFAELDRKIAEMETRQALETAMNY